MFLTKEKPFVNDNMCISYSLFVLSVSRRNTFDEPAGYRYQGNVLLEMGQQVLSATTESWKYVPNSNTENSEQSQEASFNVESPQR